MRPYNPKRLLNYFNRTYGQDDTRLESWQRLCRDLGVQQGVSIKKCKKALQGTFVNIVDFLEAKQANRSFRTFNSRKALSNYIVNNGGRKFPLNLAKESPILRWMLIELC